jgi:hypothetical protein
METTIGQLNFFKWAIENDVLKYIESNYSTIDNDMNARNTTSKRKKNITVNITNEPITGVSTSSSLSKTRKKREELSVSACKCIKTESVNIILHF